MFASHLLILPFRAGEARHSDMGPVEHTACLEIPSEGLHIPVFVLLNASGQDLLEIKSGLVGSRDAPASKGSIIRHLSTVLCLC